MFELQNLGKVIVIAGLVLAALGLMLWVGGRLGLGSLPGDVRMEGERWGCFFPIGSMIVLSVLLTIVVNVILRLFNR